MNDLYNDIEASIYLIKNDISYGIENYAPLCLFSNENGQAKNNLFHFDNKKILCPAASGDQYLNAIFYNAKEIIIYDINKLAKYILNLKIAAIKALCYEEFLLFMFPRLLGRDNKFFLNSSLLKKIIPYLDKTDFLYWQELISYFKKNGYSKFIDINNECYDEEEIKRECTFYSNNFFYNILKQKLLVASNYEFILRDIRDLEIEGQFDLIDLSNIISSLIINSYFNEAHDFTIDELNDRYINYIDKKIIPLVKDKGNIMVDYQIAVDNSTIKPWFYSKKYNPHKVKSKKYNNTDIIYKYQRS